MGTGGLILSIKKAGSSSEHASDNGMKAGRLKNDEKYII